MSTRGMLDSASAVTAQSALQRILAEPGRLSEVPTAALWRTWRLIGSALFLRGFEAAMVWIGRTQQRESLRELSDEALSDIGLSPDDVQQETRKSFWQA